jgi:hypothetical protein
MSVLTQYFAGTKYIEELKKIHRPALEDPWLVPFHVNVVYAAGGGTPHGRYLKLSILFHKVLSVHNT